MSAAQGLGRCSGHCCRNFPIGWMTPEELADKDRMARVVDGLFISDMIIPLGKDEKGQHRYTCRHHNTETGDCMAYDNRPEMCRDYPYGQPCEHAECTEGSKPDVPLSRFGVKSLGLR